MLNEVDLAAILFLAGMARNIFEAQKLFPIWKGEVFDLRLLNTQYKECRSRCGQHRNYPTVTCGVCEYDYIIRNVSLGSRNFVVCKRVVHLVNDSGLEVGKSCDCRKTSYRIFFKEKKQPIKLEDGQCFLPETAVVLRKQNAFI